MAQWLSTMPWDWWCTLTFKTEYSPDAADRAFRRWTAELRKDSPALGFFVGHEIGRQGRLHLHALIGGLETHVQRTVAWRRWFRRHGRAQLQPYDSDRGATNYAAKYVTKDGARWNIHAVGTADPSLFEREPIRRPSGPCTTPVYPLQTTCGTPLRVLHDECSSRPGTHKYPEKADLEALERAWTPWK